MNKRKSGWPAFLIGLALLVGAWLLLRLCPDLDATGWRAVPFLALGVGCGVFGAGAGELLAGAAMKKHPELQKQNEIEQKDERNVALANRAKGRAFDIMLYCYGALMVCFVLMQVETAVVLLLTAAYLFILGCFVYYRVRYEREM